MKPTNNRIFCIGCRHPKMLFATQAKADNFIRYNSEEIASAAGKAPTRSYYCTFCCGWHVTSVTDEARAKADDERDEHIWQRIMSTRRIALPLQPLDNKLSERIKAIYRMMQACRHRLCLTDIDTARNIYKDIVLETSLVRHDAIRQGVDSKKIDKVKGWVDSIRITFGIIEEYDIDSETRYLYLSNESLPEDDWAASYLRNKEFIEIVNMLFYRLEQAGNEDNAEEFNRLYQYISDTIENYHNYSISEKKKEFRTRLAECKMPGQKTSLTERNLKILRKSYLSVIETLEQAHHAIEAGDYVKSGNLIKTAECLMPDADDEISEALWKQIGGLKNRMP